jgi:hypothetical protein
VSGQRLVWPVGEPRWPTLALPGGLGPIESRPLPLRPRRAPICLLYHGVGGGVRCLAWEGQSRKQRLTPLRVLDDHVAIAWFGGSWPFSQPWLSAELQAWGEGCLLV